MSISDVLPRGLSLRAVVHAVASFRLPADPLGLSYGFNAYQAYTALDAKSDAQLAAIGLNRSDVARAAMHVANGKSQA